MAKVGNAVPSLRHIHLSHAFSEQHTAYESELYFGIRIVRFRGAHMEDWSRDVWGTPGRQRMALGYRRSSRTTQKVDFDAWGSDSEYPNCDEFGW